jgi:hypothetical protein
VKGTAAATTATAHATATEERRRCRLQTVVSSRRPALSGGGPSMVGTSSLCGASLIASTVTFMVLASGAARTGTVAAAVGAGIAAVVPA